MKKKHYTLDFKRRAVARLTNGEKPTEVAAKLKIADSMLYNWRKKLQLSEFKQKKPPQSTGDVKSAIVYLNHAKEEMTNELKTGKLKKLSKSNLYALLALDSLENG